MRKWLSRAILNTSDKTTFCDECPLLGGKADSDCNAKCPLLTQSGHRTLLCVSLSRYDVPPPRQELTKHKLLSRNNKTGLALIILNDVPIILPARWRCWAGRGRAEVEGRRSAARYFG